MVTRYSGNLRITCTYDDRGRGRYKCTVTTHGKKYGKTVYVDPSPSWFGPGVAYDSPAIYDSVAHAAISFADDEYGGIANEAEFTDSGFKIHRSPPSYSPHATGKKKARGGGGAATSKAAAHTLIGKRVEISPHYDRWMMGARYGVVNRIKDGIAFVRMDNRHVKNLARIRVEDLKRI